MACLDKAPIILSSKLTLVSQRSSCCEITLGAQTEKNQALEGITSVTCGIYLCAAEVASQKLAFLVHVSNTD